MSYKKVMKKIYSIKTKHLLLFYICSLFLFALLYYLAWKINTGSYIISDQLNIKAKNAWDLVSDDTTEPKNSNISSISLESYRNAAVPIEKEMLDLKATTVHLAESISQLSVKRDSLKDIVWENYDKNCNSQIAKRSEGVTDKLEIAKIVANVHTEALANISFYQAGPGYDEYVATYKLISKYQDSIYTCNMAIPPLRKNLYDLSTKFYQDRNWRLGYWDMLYFSFLTSTSTSFGDIIPNSTYVRILISIQIFLSLIILGIIVGKISYRYTNHDNSKE